MLVSDSKNNIQRLFGTQKVTLSGDFLRSTQTHDHGVDLILLQASEFARAQVDFSLDAASK